MFGLNSNNATKIEKYLFKIFFKDTEKKTTKHLLVQENKLSNKAKCEFY